MTKKARPSVKINATVFDADDCVQDARLSINGEEYTYYCSGISQIEIGNPTITLTFSVALEMNDTTKLAVLDAVTDTPQTAVTMEYHPGGDTATYIEATTSAGYVTGLDLSAPANGIITADVTCRWNNITMGAAS